MTSKMRGVALATGVALGLLLPRLAAAQDKGAMRSALAACGPVGVKFALTTDRSQHPAPAPEPGKARVYLMGDATFAIDGQWVGKTTSKTYLSVSLDAGVHHLCARYSHWLPWYAIIYVWTKSTAYSVHSLDVKPGGVYYLGPQGNPGNPPQIAGYQLLQYDPEEGARIVAASRLGVSRRK